jgi:cation diffusion facilitator CzcD-associated flavoprotein CzcO
MGVPVPFQVVVIGAGFGGIGMAIALKQAGIDDFVVADRAGDLGGTWRDNSYPGLTCDIPSHLYSFSFQPWHWSRRFPPREEILAYLHALAAERGLGPHLRFDCASSSSRSRSAPVKVPGRRNRANYLGRSPGRPAGIRLERAEQLRPAVRLLRAESLGVRSR